MKMDKFVCPESIPIMGGWKCVEEVFGDLSASHTPSVSLMLQSSVGCLDTSQTTLWVRSATSITLCMVSEHAYIIMSTVIIVTNLISIRINVCRKPDLFNNYYSTKPSLVCWFQLWYLCQYP